MIEPNIQGIEFTGAEILFEGKIEEGKTLDLGSINLQLKEKGFALDISDSYREFVDNKTYVHCKVIVDQDVLSSPYDLNAEDLNSKNLVSTIFIGGSLENKLLEAEILYSSNKGTKNSIKLVPE